MDCREAGDHARMTPHEHILDFFSSSWLRDEGRDLFGTMGVLIQGPNGVGEAYTLDLTSSTPMRRGLSTACEGVLTVDAKDEDFARMARLAKSLERAPAGVAAAIRIVLRAIFTRKFFTALAALTLDHPVTSSPFLLAVSRTDSVFHAVLVPEEAGEGEERCETVYAAHTALNAGGRWHVRPGFVGDVRRLFVLTPDEAREYMVRLRRAQRSSGLRSVLEWFAFFAWYVKWRAKVSVQLGGDR
jgi:hypothetical protein